MVRSFTKNILHIYQGDDNERRQNPLLFSWRNGWTINTK